jgi:flagellar hook assembly protein FlgD
MVPHLRIVLSAEAETRLVGASDVSRVHTVPDPYYTQSRFDLSPVEKALRFVNLPHQATIRIYTVSGLLVDVINHNDLAGGGLTTWDLKNRSGQFVASGVYFFHVSTPDGQEHIGRFTVINSGIGQ